MYAEEGDKQLKITHVWTSSDKEYTLSALILPLIITSSILVWNCISEIRIPSLQLWEHLKAKSALEAKTISLVE